MGIGYLVVLAAQPAWLNLIAPRTMTQRLLLRLWWPGCGMIVLSELALWQVLELTGGPARLVLGVQPSCSQPCPSNRRFRGGAVHKPQQLMMGGS
jgi:hypothetical protein